METSFSESVKRQEMNAGIYLICCFGTTYTDGMGGGGGGYEFPSSEFQN